MTECNRRISLKSLIAGTLFTLLSHLDYAHAEANTNFSVSYMDYPQNEPYLSLITDVYKELGITISLIPTPATRGLKLANEGKVDADIMRLSKSAREYPNLIVVEPPLKIVKLVLLCTQNVVCDSTVLEDKKEVLLTTEGILNYLDKYNVQATLETIQIVENIAKMLSLKRTNYAIFVGDDSIEIFKPFKQFTLQDISLYHVIHKKHAELLPKIEQKLREKLLLRDASTKP
ncbi:hypothetical protein [Paraglaciecola sp.]|uniref:hypothetical protein n=1 Tax=Paraglaciecola sp. TaxID=1920173 RepID=UPI00273E77CF|nr:hypothetical protein [Paraglaciecola sp.]MDP5031327.1 hypothetical protein [Paraglaciecola sp.]